LTWCPARLLIRSSVRWLQKGRLKRMLSFTHQMDVRMPGLHVSKTSFNFRFSVLELMIRSSTIASHQRRCKTTLCTWMHLRGQSTYIASRTGCPTSRQETPPKCTARSWKRSTSKIKLAFRTVMWRCFWRMQLRSKRTLTTCSETFWSNS
jgi:hypothetical protein